MPKRRAHLVLGLILRIAEARPAAGDITFARNQDEGEWSHARWRVFGRRAKKKYVTTSTRRRRPGRARGKGVTEGGGAEKEQSKRTGRPIKK